MSHRLPDPAESTDKRGSMQFIRPFLKHPFTVLDPAHLNSPDFHGGKKLWNHGHHHTHPQCDSHFISWMVRVFLEVDRELQRSMGASLQWIMCVGVMLVAGNKNIPDLQDYHCNELSLVTHAQKNCGGGWTWRHYWHPPDHNHLWTNIMRWQL